MPYRFFKNSSSSKGLCTLIGFFTGVGSTNLLSNTKDKKNKAKQFLFEPKKLQIEHDYLAPDASEIRLLQTKQHAQNGDMAHCKLPTQSTSIAIKHKTVEEIWYFTNGIGEMWLKERNGDEHIFTVEKDMALTIPSEASFQFRNISKIEPLEIIITTMPPWPGPEEAVKVQGRWEPSIKNRENQYRYKKI